MGHDTGLVREIMYPHYARCVSGEIIHNDGGLYLMPVQVHGHRDSIVSAIPGHSCVQVYWYRGHILVCIYAKVAYRMHIGWGGVLFSHVFSEPLDIMASIDAETRASAEKMRTYIAAVNGRPVSTQSLWTVLDDPSWEILTLKVPEDAEKLHLENDDIALVTVKKTDELYACVNVFTSAAGIARIRNQGVIVYKNDAEIKRNQHETAFAGNGWYNENLDRENPDIIQQAVNAL